MTGSTARPASTRAERALIWDRLTSALLVLDSEEITPRRQSPLIRWPYPRAGGCSAARVLGAAKPYIAKHASSRYCGAVCRTRAERSRKRSGRVTARARKTR
jgi:hypothetical protein